MEPGAAEIGAADGAPRGTVAVRADSGGGHDAERSSVVADANVEAAKATVKRIGSDKVKETMKKALAMGCDSACLVADKALKDADTAVAVRALAAAVGKLGGADLIIAGRASGDTGTGQMAPRLAEALGYARVTDVYALAVRDGALQATRRWGQGYAALEAPLPAVVSVAPEAFPPRFAHGARIMNAYRLWEVTTWGAADLELSEEDTKPLLSRRGESFPPPLETGEVFRGEPAKVAGDAVMALRLQKLIGA